MERVVGEAKIRVPEDGGAYGGFVMTEYDDHAGELNLAENRQLVLDQGPSIPW